MKKLRRNNKGFSLVELIVVVLIMAIIAVALAPQVMKWVGNSRTSTDAQVYDSLVSDVQLAIADESIWNEVKNAATDSSKEIKIEIKKSGVTITDSITTGNKFAKKLAEIAGATLESDNKTIKDISLKEDQTYEIKVSEGKVSRTATPAPDTTT